MSKLHDLAYLGQSIWLDYIRRDMLDSGKLSQLQTTGVRGVTSNPSIFEKAISESDDYDDALRLLAAEGKSPMEIYETLAIEDIQRAADIFHSLFEQTEGEDGYVSLEVSPNLAHDTEATIAEAHRLFARVDRPNVYIKVPATVEGIPAIEQLISDGVNVNVTLIFALQSYEAVAEAYLRGLERRVAAGESLRNVSSVASFFVSRVDTKVDKALDALEGSSLRGQIGIANAKMAYQRFLEIFRSERWEELAEKGAHVQRPLWGSTSTKDPAYLDTMYIDELIGPYTVNTVPPRTLEAFLDHGTVERTIDEDVELARAQLVRLGELGISLDAVTAELLDEGVEKFAVAFNSLMETITRRRARVLAEGEGWDAVLGNYEGEVRETLQALEDERVLARLWDKDYTLWGSEATEISNRLGWLGIAAEMSQDLTPMMALADGVRADGYTDVVLLGMGGSSLAPELFARTFGPAEGHPSLTVLDSTDPGAVSSAQRRLNPETTLFVVSSKSGGTVETLSLFNYFYTWIASTVGADDAGEHFVAVTDPESRLVELSEKYDFRALFLNNPDIGGRYSALSYFGLVPAALLGIDLVEFLGRAQSIAGPEDAALGAWLGTVLAVLAQRGRDKLTFIISPEIASFADWVEQLIAESTGKEGKGILPVVGEPPSAPDSYDEHRLFVYMRLADGTHYDEQAADIAEAGHPVITINVLDRYDLAEQMLVWEIATAVAGHLLGIQPFNQPNVEAAKMRAREMVAIFRQRGLLPAQRVTLKSGHISVYESQVPADTPAEALDSFVGQAHGDGYIAVHAYIEPSEQNEAALLNFRTYLREKSGLPVTVGYGPRFLHSTGQLHKGDAGRGLFIQITTEPLQDLPIPDEPGGDESTLTFGTLKMAQALGDAQALQDAGRRVLRFHLWGPDVPALLAELKQ